MSKKAHTPVVLSRPEHNISRDLIDPDALKVLYRLKRFGFAGFLVGGSVRDMLIGRTPKDFDIGTDAHPNEIKRLFRNCFLIGRRFRLAHIRFGRKIIETSTFRRLPEKAESDGSADDLYQHRDNTFGSPEEDAQRRDFTVNGMFYDIKTFSVIDYVDGLKDLKARTIRCIGDPDVRFREDPVRMLRAVRFAARLDFAVERKTWRAVRKHASEIGKAPPARVLEELYRLFPYGSGEAAMRLLHKAGLMTELLPEIATFLKRDRKGGARFWVHLRSLDGTPTVLGDSAAPGLILGVLFMVPFLRRLETTRPGGSAGGYQECAREILDEAASRLQVPRRLYHTLVHALAGQQRFEPSRRRRISRERFARLESFPLALALYQIRVGAGEADADAVAGWLDVFETVARQSADRAGKEGESQEGNARPRRKPRRRRRRGPRPQE